MLSASERRRFVLPPLLPRARAPPAAAPSRALSRYDLDIFNGSQDPSMVKSGDELLAFYEKLVDNYPIVTMEDVFDQV